MNLGKITLLAAILIAALLVTVAVWRLVWLKRSIQYIAKDEMPIWLSLLLAISAGVGTYFVAPLINESFEFQKNRSTHLISTIDELNKGVVSLAVSVRQFNDALFYDKKTLMSARGSALDKISELQWRLVDADVIIQRVSPKSESTKKLSESLLVLQNTIIEAKLPEDQEKVAKAHTDVVGKAKASMLTLYSAARI